MKFKLVSLFSLIGETAKRLFKNLKKRYNKRRNHLKKAECSGTSAVTVSLAKEKVEEFRFLAWLNPFIRQRRTKASLLKKQEWAEVSKAENVSNVEGNYKASESRQQDCSNDFEDVNFPTVNGIPSTSHERKRPTESPMSVVTGRKKWGKETPSLDEVDHSFLASAKRAIETPTQDDEGVFGMLVASDLRKLNQFNKMIARNRIQNLLFELQLQEQGQLQCPKQSTPNSMAQNNP